MRQHKVTVEGIARKGKAPPGAKLLAEIEGPDLQKLIREMNVHSLNVVADNLLILLGAEKYGGPGTMKKGLTAVNDFIVSLGLLAGGAAIADGSGLSGENRVTAKCMAHYLQKVAERSWFQSFRDSLPRAGMEGTLKEIGYRNEKFRVKSGNLENVTALAGYGVDKSGREIAFTFLVNTPGPLPPNARSAGDEVMRFLAE